MAVVSDIASPIEFFRSVDLLVYLPLGGSGAKVKVLEALAYGIPVVTNRYGVEGLHPAVVEVINVVDSPTEAAEVTVAMLRDSRRRHMQALAARERLDAWHGPSVVSQRWAPVLGTGG